MQNGTDDKGTDRGIYKKKSPNGEISSPSEIPFSLLHIDETRLLSIVRFRIEVVWSDGAY